MCALLFLFISLNGTAEADTNICGTINTTTTWTLSGSPYVATCPVRILSSGIVTVEPGVTIKFASTAYLQVYGRLTAIGTLSQPITFTASAATPTRGSWWGIFFEAGSANSTLSYVTVSYGGASNWNPYNALLVIASSTPPAMDHLTLKESSGYGMIYNSAATATMSDSKVELCTIDGIYVETGGLNLVNTTVWWHTGYGIYVNNSGAIYPNNLTISNNGNYAIAIYGNAGITMNGPVTATGNGGGTKNSIAFVNGLITSSNLVWDAGLERVILASPNIWNGAKLTVKPGSILKFPAGKRIDVNGTLIADGTAAQPITFTSSAATPTPGSWYGIYFLAAGTASRISYATISYGGGDAAQESLAWMDPVASPTFDHVTFSNSQRYGIKAGLNGGSTSAPVIKNCSFTGNALGAIKNDAPGTITAWLNYWNAANGPSGSGTGSGQWISTKVSYDPWITSAPSNAYFFNNVSFINRTFNPTLAINATISFDTNLSGGSWTSTIKTTGGTLLRSFSGAGQTGAVVWDGKDSAGVTMPNGVYQFEIQSTGPAGQIAPSVKGTVTIDTSKQLAIQSYTVSPAFFSPNGDSAQDTTTASASFTFDDVNWTLNIKASDNTVVRTTSGVGSSLNYVWNGKDAANIVQADGLYTFDLQIADGSATAGMTRTVTLDKIFPVSQILYPVDGLLSNFYNGGYMNFLVTATISDLNLNNWILDWASTAVPNTWYQLAAGTTASAGGSILNWQTESFVNGTYYLRLQTWDKAGNRTAHTRNVTLGNFKVTLVERQINVTNSGFANYISTIPFTLTETVVIRNQQGQVVRTLASGAVRTAGNYGDVWNGKTSTGGYLPDGPYWCIITVTDGTTTLTWDLTNTASGEWTHYGYIPGAWDPFNNNPLKLTFQNNVPARFLFVFSPTYYPGQPHGIIASGCNPPNYCAVEYEYKPSGTHTFTWAGVDGTGAFRGDMKGFLLAHDAGGFDKNAVVVFGTKPAITNSTVTVTPAFYNPQKGNQTISFGLSTFQNQTVNVTSTFLNQSSLSVLRTINLTNVSPGTVNITWNGKGDNGLWVAPGNYLVTVQVTNSLGNTVSSQILTTVRY